MSCDQSHYYRQVWYWGGEADLRVNGKKMELTTIASEEWDQVVKDAESFWDELASISPRAARVIDIFKKYNATMEQVGVPYRHSRAAEGREDGRRRAPAAALLPLAAPQLDERVDGEEGVRTCE